MRHSLNIAAISAVSTLLLSVGPAEAGRCGHSYPVDKPTTLTEVARQCNVNLSALYEANPGVNPNNVRPGEHLAVPDEIDRYDQNAQVHASTPAPSQNTSEADVSSGSSHPYIVSRDYSAPITDDVGLSASYERAELRRVSSRVDRSDDQFPVWLREENLGARHHSSADRLSYQQLSALRIANAGLPRTPIRAVSSTPVVQTELIECPVLRRRSDGRIHKVRKIISTPENTFVEISASPSGAGFDCALISGGEISSREMPTSTSVALTPGVPAAHYNKTSNNSRSRAGGYRLPDYNKIGFIPVSPTPVLSNEPMMLSGSVFDIDRGCALLRTENGDLWRLSADQTTTSLLGKEVSVWGTQTRNDNVCGSGISVKVSHAVYAEPWPKQ
ncbi:MAG: hypothetical protein DHS20C05_22620 [Hyphococcus sp.]|nr:MAG: hypothetical protein DHS20C05_22620 [Marinicaulis sp.]